MISSLSEMPLFAGLSPADCAAFERRLQRRDYVPQAVIVREGGAGDAAFLIMAGRVAVRRKDPQSGLEFQLAELGPGQIFGEMSLLTGQPRTASVVALEATTCAVLAREDFERVAREHPDVALTLARSVAGRLELANEHAGIDFVNLARAEIDPRVLSLL